MAEVPVAPTAVLFPPELLEALAHLRIAARRVPAGGRHAEHHARESGAGIEFRDHRAYAPGDDLRRVDWHLWGRFARLFLRLSDETRDLPLHLLVDVSDSTWLEVPPRSFAGRQAAGVLAAVSLGQADRVHVFPFGAALGEGMPPASGSRGLPRVLAFLEDLRPLGRTDFQAALWTFARLPLRSGLCVVVSDFFDPAGLAAVREALAAIRHRLLLVRLVRRSDRDPALQGELRLVDCETGDGVDVTLGARALEAYRKEVSAFDQGLRTLAEERGAGEIEIDVEAPVLPQLEPLFAGGVFRP